MELYYEIAGLKVAMDSFGRAVEQAKPYLVENKAPVDNRIVSEWESLKVKYPFLPDDEGEYLATGKSFYKGLLDFEGMMLHASAVVVEGRAYLFTADSGTGKSTHTGLWMKQFGNKAYILNDDKPAIRAIDGIWYAYGTPWSGKDGINSNESAKLAGIAVLERGKKNEIEPLSGKEAIFKIYKQLNRKTESVSFREKQMELLDKLLRDIPVWKLKCNMEPEAAIVAYEAMSGQKFG